MRKFLSALLFGVVASSMQAANCSDPNGKDCSFYRGCLEKKIACGATGYALGYGEKYCKRFKQSTDFSTKGIAWRDVTMKCLQKALVPLVESSSSSPSCESITDQAFDSHPKCYTQPGNSVCDLDVSDLYNIYSIIDGTDLLSSRGLKQIKKVAAICLSSLRPAARAAAHRPGILMAPASFANTSNLEARIKFWQRIYDEQ